MICSTSIYTSLDYRQINKPFRYNQKKRKKKKIETKLEREKERNRDKNYWKKTNKENKFCSLPHFALHSNSNWWSFLCPVFDRFLFLSLCCSFVECVKKFPPVFFPSKETKQTIECELNRWLFRCSDFTFSWPMCVCLYIYETKDEEKTINYDLNKGEKYFKINLFLVLKKWKKWKRSGTNFGNSFNIRLFLYRNDNNKSMHAQCK